MGIWSERVVPRIIDKAMATGEMRNVRTQLCSGLHGEVVEVGFGSGLSVPLYPKTVRRVLAIEPSARALALARPRIDASPVDVVLAGDDGQHLAIDDASVDVALSMYTLCTIPDAEAALREIHRVLRPGATLRFAEHGHSPDESVAKWQRRLEPIQKRLFAGCHLARRIDELVIGAGFTIDEMENRYEKGVPKPFGYMYVGTARKTA